MDTRIGVFSRPVPGLGKMANRRLWRAAMLSLALGFMVTACGGGGGGGAAPPGGGGGTPTNCNWNQVNWNQFNWC